MFPRRVYPITKARAVTLGTSVDPIELSRDNHLAGLMITLTGTATKVNGANPAGYTDEGIWKLIKRVELTLPSGDATKVVDVTGPSLMGLTHQLNGSLGYAFDKYGTGDFALRFPIHCEQPQFLDPVASMFLLPLPEFDNKAALTVTLATNAAEVASNMGFTNLKLTVTEDRRYVTKLPKSLRWALIDTDHVFAATGPSALEFKLGGSLMGAQIVGLNAARTAYSDAAGQGYYSLDVMRAPIEQFTSQDKIDENMRSLATTYGAPGFYLDFVTPRLGQTSPDFGKLLSTESASNGRGTVSLAFENAVAGAIIRLTDYRINERDETLAPWMLRNAKNV